MSYWLSDHRRSSREVDNVPLLKKMLYQSYAHAILFSQNPSNHTFHFQAFI